MFQFDKQVEQNSCQIELTIVFTLNDEYTAYVVDELQMRLCDLNCVAIMYEAVTHIVSFE